MIRYVTLCIVRYLSHFKNSFRFFPTVFRSFFESRKIFANSFQLFSYHKWLTVEKKLQRFFWTQKRSENSWKDFKRIFKVLQRTNNTYLKKRYECIIYSFLQQRELLKHFKIPARTMVNFLMTLEDHYVKDIPYHNHLHAADVTQSTHILLNSPNLEVIKLITF